MATITYVRDATRKARIARNHVVAANEACQKLFSFVTPAVRAVSHCACAYATPVLWAQKNY
eukprot:605724-Pelagomonas_calceolata.AAC.1